MFSTDESYRGGAEKTCDCCGQPSRRTWSLVVRDGAPYALFFAACYDHGELRESWIDVVFGTWGNGTDYHDHVTFGCRFGPVSNSPLPAATAVDAASVAPDGPLFGQKLSREQALAHPRISDFWQVVDFIVETDPLVHEHHYGHQPTLVSSRSISGGERDHLSGASHPVLPVETIIQLLPDADIDVAAAAAANPSLPEAVMHDLAAAD